MNRSSLHFLWKDRRVLDGFRTGVSLHGHTLHSRENLKFLHTFKLPLPLIPAALRVAGWHHRRATSRPLELARVIWTPALAPAEAHRLEMQQIQKSGLEPLVSLTDHDDIESGMDLRRGPPSNAPISFEWTIPFGPTFFHVGVHNLPARRARAIFGDLQQYTTHPEPHRLAELLSMLHREPQVLTILNHPLWDEAGIGEAPHRAAVDALLSAHRRWIHAVELNGLRAWAENREALALARAWQLPAISGGDRHGLEPNANLNLTNAATFHEFVAEVRDGHSHVLFMPQYREPLRLRWFETVADIVRWLPGTQRSRWVDRFFYECEDGVTRSISELWEHEGPALRPFFALLQISEIPGLRAAMRLTGSDPAEVLA